MWRPTIYAWSALAVLALAACDDGSPGGPNGISDGAVAVVANVDSDVWPRDPLTITAASISADTLRLTVQYGGGCATHRIALLIGSVFLESHPVQVLARLAHDAGGDMCEALITRTLALDLTPLKQRYRQSYGPGAAEIILNLAGYTPIRYAFQ